MSPPPREAAPLNSRQAPIRGRSGNVRRVSLKDTILGIPFVYNVLRPLAVGGIDMDQVLSPLKVEATDAVVDVGCGTGIALEHLPPFARYVGFDTDRRALDAARKRAARRAQERIEFRERRLERADIEDLAPQVVILAGLLHHLDDATSHEVLQSLLGSPRLRSVVTVDVTFLPDRFVNNLSTILDRGQYPRHPAAYSWLAERAGFQVDEAKTIPSRSGSRRVAYWWMKLSPHPR
jgi:SAM-dependent methyltransferase